MSSVALKSLCRTAMSQGGRRLMQRHSRHGLLGSLRSYAFAAAAPELEESYVSELQELFDLMERNGPTTLGTTSSDDLGWGVDHEKYLKCGVPESALRFTTISYGRLMLPPYVHANEHRVVMTMRTDRLNLSPLEKHMLREIVGARYNEERNTLTLSSNQFGSRIENKRHLVSMLDRIMLSCQTLAKEAELEDAGLVASATTSTKTSP